jgi:hypothetical protein
VSAKEVGKFVTEAEALGREIKDQRTWLSGLMSRARQFAVRGHRLGLSDAYLARVLHVDRARTIPRWLRDEE